MVTFTWLRSSSFVTRRAKLQLHGIRQDSAGTLEATPATRSRYRFIGNEAPYLLTLTINTWLPVFTRPETVDVFLNSWLGS